MTIEHLSGLRTQRRRAPRTGCRRGPTPFPRTDTISASSTPFPRGCRGPTPFREAVGDQAIGVRQAFVGVRHHFRELPASCRSPTPFPRGCRGRHHFRELPASCRGPTGPTPFPRGCRAPTPFPRGCPEPGYRGPTGCRGPVRQVRHHFCGNEARHGFVRHRGPTGLTPFDGSLCGMHDDRRFVRVTDKGYSAGCRGQAVEAAGRRGPTPFPRAGRGPRLPGSDTISPTPIFRLPGPTQFARLSRACGLSGCPVGLSGSDTISADS